MATALLACVDRLAEAGRRGLEYGLQRASGAYVGWLVSAS
jgi:hypothetical protein